MKTVFVIFGGRSAEHDVSIITAHIPIISALQAAGGYTIYPIYIAKNGSWYSDPAFLNLEYFQQADYEQHIRKLKPLQIGLGNGFTISWPGIRSRQVAADVVFPAMHGTYGEDGSLMGVLRLAKVAFVGCDMAASAVAMDKILTKQVAAANDIPVVPYVWFSDREWESDAQAIRERIKKLAYPLFVKPPHLGSSIGISKAENAKELENAIEVALHYDDKVLIETAVSNLIEVTLPVMGNETPRPGLIERALNKTEFFNFSDKYLAGGKTKGVSTQYSELPAKLGQKMYDKALDVGVNTYKALGCEGIARVDMLIDDKTGKVYMNEVNTLPGSLYHHNWRKAGVSSVSLVNRLVELAEQRAAKNDSKTVTFDSTILRQIAGSKTGLK